MSRFALPEWERRWLLASAPTGEVVRVADIEDRYLPGPGLRLRRMTSSDGVEHKLTQKTPGDDGGPGTLTTIYLTADQASSLHVIEGYVLRKRRLSIPPYGVDVFSGQLEGLLLAEAEVLTSAADLAAVPDPPGAVAEVTRDLTFTGGRLAVTSAEDLRRALATYGL
jgi:CYTH domain-containing protein